MPAELKIKPKRTGKLRSTVAPKIPAKKKKELTAVPITDIVKTLEVLKSNLLKNKRLISSQYCVSIMKAL